MRYVMSNRRAGKFSESQKAASQAAVSGVMNLMSVGMSVVSDSQPEDELDRRIVVFDADPAEIQAKAATVPPDVLIEPEILHWPAGRIPFRLFQSGPSAGTPYETGVGNSLTITVKIGDHPAANATVHLAFRGVGGLATNAKSRTNAQGQATFQHSNFWTPASAVAAPDGDFWTMVALGPTNGLVITCPALPKDGPLGWWHHALGIQQHKVTRGKSIKVGVIDTGCGPHPSLAHVTLVGAFINGAILPAADAADVDSHGSHVCGTIGARPAQNGEYAGVSPGVSLFAARVFPDADSGANQGDIAAAIDTLSKTHAADLINLSLGASQGSQIELDAIQDALERGTLCICAAGNSNGAVEYPAKFEQCVAVAAIGQLGWGPPNSLAALRVPTGQSQRFGIENLFHASFSCFGEGLDISAPGVGLLATVTERGGLQAPFGVMDGTSMASPAACGALAALLAGSTAYKALPRDATRAVQARKILQDNLRFIGMTALYQGGGMPFVS